MTDVAVRGRLVAMQMPMLVRALVVGVGLSAAAGCMDMTMTQPGAGSQGPVTVENEETNPLFSLFLDPIGRDPASMNLLGTSQLFPGDTLVLSIGCAHYDVRVAVAGGDQPPGVGMCTISDQDVCATSPFVISSANCDLGE